MAGAHVRYMPAITAALAAATQLPSARTAIRTLLERRVSGSSGGPRQPHANAARSSAQSRPPTAARPSAPSPSRASTATRSPPRSSPGPRSRPPPPAPRHRRPRPRRRVRTRPASQKARNPRHRTDAQPIKAGQDADALRRVRQTRPTQGPPRRPQAASQQGSMTANRCGAPRRSSA